MQNTKHPKQGSQRAISPVVWAAWLALVVAGRAVSQEGPRRPPAVEPTDIAVGVVSGLLGVSPTVFDFGSGPPGCLPCPESDVPSFDRFAIANPRGSWSTVSDFTLVGFAAVGGWDLLDRGAATPEAVAFAESGTLAGGLTLLLKAAVARNRPVLYTNRALELKDPAGSRDSWPSGHTAVAFAMATSYVLSRRHDPRTLPARIAAVAVAVGIGTLRVASAQHFPSDVLSGAALGIGSALAVHAIKF